LVSLPGERASEPPCRALPPPDATGASVGEDKGATDCCSGDACLAADGEDVEEDDDEPPGDCWPDGFVSDF
jgi:hypothetical protein